MACLLLSGCVGFRRHFVSFWRGVVVWYNLIQDSPQNTEKRTLPWFVLFLVTPRTLALLLLWLWMLHAAAAVRLVRLHDVLASALHSSLLAPRYVLCLASAVMVSRRLLSFD